MINWKKTGLTALAGSLVATSAFAGALTVSGTANLTYTANSGAQDYDGTSALEKGVDGNRWGRSRAIGFSGSGEMDNGWTVSMSTSLVAGGTSGNGLTLDMGDLGSLHYEDNTSGRGISKIADMMPAANEEVWDGIDTNGANKAAGFTVSGKVGGGGTGFHYSNTISDMVEIGIGYDPKTAATSSPGGVSGAGGAGSGVTGFVKLDPMDGLEIGIGTGEVASASASQMDDVQTYYATYVYGPITVGYQKSNLDTYAAGTADDESTTYSILYAINDELSISYGEWKNDGSGEALDEEMDGIGVSYTMGSMSFTAQRNEATNVGNAAANASEHTEFGVTFAF